MKKSLMKGLAAAVSAVMMCGVLGLLPAEKSLLLKGQIDAKAAASDFTADEAIDWVKSQVGKTQSLGGTQCVALINGYMNFLGVNWTQYRVFYASDFSKPQYCPPGWTQLQNATPQKGDVLIYGGIPEHVAICESVDVHYDQNVWNSETMQYEEWVHRINS